MHRPRHLREALLTWLDQPDETVVVPGQSDPWDVRRLVDELWASTDTLPADVCDRLGLPPGCTYGHAVRLIMWAHDRNPGAPLSEAVGSLQSADSGEVQPVFDAISDLLREEDHVRTQP